MLVLYYLLDHTHVQYFYNIILTMMLQLQPDMYMCIVLSLTVQGGFSPLYAASQEGHTEIVDLLVRAGADVNQAAEVHTEVT